MNTNLLSKTRRTLGSLGTRRGRAYRYNENVENEYVDYVEAISFLISCL